MLLPLPDWVGKPLLWNHVQAARMQFAAGVLLTCLTFVAANSFGLKLSLLRGAILSAIILFAWYHIKRPEDRSIVEELVFLFLAMVVCAGVLYLLKDSLGYYLGRGLSFFLAVA